MPVSASIYNAIGQGVTPLQDPQSALLKALRMQGAQEEMQAQRMTRARTEDEYRRGVERSNRLQQLAYGDYADDDARANAYIRSGFIDEGQKLLKGRADLRKIGADTDKTLTETDAARYKQHLDLLGAVQDPESFKQWVQLGMSSGAIKEGGNILLQAASQVQTPQQFQQLQARVGMGLKDYLEKNAPKFSTVNAGNAQVTTGRGGLFGEVMPELGQTTVINQSPDNAASNARQAADAAAARALTLRGQNMVDARAREAAARADGAAVADAGGPGQAAMVRQFGKAPPGYRWKPDGSAEAIPGGPADIKAGEAGAKSVAKREAQIAQAESVLGTIQDAKGLVGYSTAGAGGLAARIPMTDARNLQAKLETVKANLGFDRLQQMRDNSPTGGALGAVAVQELTALQSTVASLDQLQSPTQLAKALEKIEGHYTRWLDVMKQSSGGQGGASGSFGDKSPAGKPARIASDAEYNALPSGAMFVGPDGKTRRKP